MAGYSGRHEDVKAFGRGPPTHQNLSGYQVIEDRRAFGRGPSMEYGPPGGGMEPQRERFNTLQGATGVRQNNIIQERDYHMGASYPTTHTHTTMGFTGPEPIIHNEAEFDKHIQSTKGNCYTDDVTRESTGTKIHSAQLFTLTANRFEMPNHPSYHGNLTSKEAEGRLSMAMASGGNCYLTRYSKTRESYVLSTIVFHDGIREPVHIKLNVDTEKCCHSLEGTEKIFRTLDELLNYFEKNPLSSDIRSIGSPCLPPEQYQHTTSATTRMTGEYPESNQPSMSTPTSGMATDPNQLSVIREMQKDFISALSKQQDDHKKEMEEERKLFREEIGKERQMHKELLEDQKKAEEPNAEAVAAQAQNPKPEPQKKPAEEKKKKDDCTLL